MNTGRYRLLLPLLLSAFLCLPAACQDAAPPAKVLGDLSEPALEGFDREVREQLRTAHEKAARLMKSSSEAARETAEALGLLGSLYLAYELQDAALESFQFAHRLAPGEIRWVYYLGALHQERGELETAERFLLGVVEKQPENRAARIRLGNLLLESDRLQEADAFYRAALESDRKLAAAHFGLGRVAARRGDHQAAVEAFESALQLQPQATQVHYALAQSYRRLGNNGRAREHLLKRGEARVTFPDPLMAKLAGLTVGAPGHAFRGDRAVLEGRLQDAKREYGRAVALAPESYFYRKSLALTLYQLGEAEDALQAMRQAIERDPGTNSELSSAHYTLGGMLANRGAVREAAGHFRKATELDPANLDAHFQLGQLAGQSGQLEEALEHFERVVQINPNHVEAIRFAATTNMDLGRFVEAIPHLRRLMELEPENSRNRWLLKIASERK